MHSDIVAGEYLPSGPSENSTSTRFKNESVGSTDSDKALQKEMDSHHCGIVPQLRNILAKQAQDVEKTCLQKIGDFFTHLQSLGFIKEASGTGTTVDESPGANNVLHNDPDTKTANL